MQWCNFFNVTSWIEQWDLQKHKLYGSKIWKKYAYPIKSASSFTRIFYPWFFYLLVFSLSLSERCFATFHKLFLSPQSQSFDNQPLQMILFQVLRSWKFQSESCLSSCLLIMSTKEKIGKIVRKKKFAVDELFQNKKRLIITSEGSYLQLVFIHHNWRL